MTTVAQVDSLGIPAEGIRASKVKQGIMIALSILFTLGMVVSYALGAPWLIPFLFFSLALAPLYPLGKVVDSQRERILEK